MAQQLEGDYRKGKAMSPLADDTEAMEDPIRSKFEDTRKHNPDSFNQEDFY